MNDLGRKGELWACRYLKKEGYRILERNYTTKVGEIDIIAEEQGVLVFVEVKTRLNDAYGLPREAVDRGKQHKIIRVAQMYLLRLPRLPVCRFDVVEVYGKKEICLIRNAFDANAM